MSEGGTKNESKKDSGKPTKKVTKHESLKRVGVPTQRQVTENQRAARLVPTTMDEDRPRSVRSATLLATAKSKDIKLRRIEEAIVKAAVKKEVDDLTDLMRKATVGAPPPAPMEEDRKGGRRKNSKRTSKSQKGGEVEGALATEVASQPARAELLGPSN